MRTLFLAGNTRSLVANRGELISQILARGNSVHAIVPAYDLLPDIEQLGISWEAVPLRRTGLNPIFDLGSIIGLASRIKKQQPDKVFAYGIKPIIYGVQACRLARISEVYALITGLGYVFTGRSRKQRILQSFVRRLYRYSLSRCSAIFFQNHDDLQLFQELGILQENSRTVLVNGSGVHTDRFPLSAIPSGPPVFLVIARLLKDKGIIEFVEAATTLKARYPQARFQILGPHDPNLPHAVSASTLASWAKNPAVELLGHQKDVRPFIRAAHVYVLPSYREGTPRSVLEAMSMGRPIVTTDAPGCRETVIEGVNGFLVPPRTVEPLAQAMERFILNPEIIEPMGLASRRIAEEKYDVHKVNRVIMETMGLL